MRNTSITIRTNTQLKKQLEKFVKQLELSISDYFNMVMRASVEGKIRLGFSQREEPFEYPEWFLKELEEQSEETMRLYKEGKIKGYTNADEAMKALLEEAEQCK